MCLSLAWLAQMLIWVVVVVAVVSIIKLFVPWVFARLGVTIDPIFLQIINIVVWAIVTIFAIYVVFTLLGCLVGSPFAFPHR